MPLIAGNIANSLAAGDMTSLEVLEESFKAIDAQEQTVAAFITMSERDELRQQAEEIDRLRARGELLPAYAGIPIAVKDNIAVKGQRLTCGSRMLEQYRTPFDATAIVRLKQQRLLIIGKTNMDEFGFGSSTENSAFHVTCNPWKLDHVPGGTSGGSAAAVAAGYCPWALGSDTGGSIRQPASFCGVFGLRPTYGRVSRYGLAAYASSMDTIGPIANSCADLLVLLRMIQGFDPLDATSSFESSSPTPVAPIRLGILGELFGPPCTVDVATAGVIVEEAARSCGWNTKQFSLRYASESLATYYIIASVEAASNLGRYDGIKYGYRAENSSSWEDLIVHSRTQGFGKEAKHRILLGTFAASAGYADKYYETACKVRRVIYNEYMRILSECDVLLAPISPFPAWSFGEKSHDPMQMYLSDVLSVSVSLAGIPAVAIPTSLNDNGLPIGVQLIGRPHSDEMLLELAGVLSEQIKFPVLSRGQP